jgi:two-component system sensor histidine kinase ChvG
MTALRTHLARLARIRPSRIGLRLLAFNLLLVFLPIAGILYLDVYEAQLLEAQERSMVQQGRIIAAALSEHEEVTSDGGRALLSRLGQRGDSRIRVYDRTAALVADSARDGGPAVADRAASEASSDYEAAATGVRQRLLYRVGAWLANLRRSVRSLVGSMRTMPAVSDRGSATPAGSEVRAALEGRYGAATRATPGQRSLTLYSAVPIRHKDRIIGAAVVSQSTFRILQALYEVRLRIFEIVLASVAVAIVLGLVMSQAIVRPLVRLQRAALALADRRARPGRFASVNRRDEIGDLARALEDQTSRLEAHIRLLESFAADVSHEFKNPLASIRTAAELLDNTDDSAERRRLIGMLTRDVDRLERLVSGVRELARIDAQLAHDALEPVDVPALLNSLVSGFEQQGHRVRLTADVGPATPDVRATPDRLAQVFENLLQNAVSFAPAESPIEVAVSAADLWCTVAVHDRGPGIPPAHLDRVFERFFTYRPENASRRDHTGLGLAIARAIVEGYGGSIRASNRNGGGATFEVRLPLARRAPPASAQTAGARL